MTKCWPLDWTVVVYIASSMVNGQPCIAHWAACSSHNNVDGFLPPRSEFFAQMQREPAAASRTPAPFKEHGLDLATPRRTATSLPGG